MRPKLLFVVNEDAFFVSHRLEIGTAARDVGLDVVVAAGPGGARATLESHGLRTVELPFDRGGRSPTRDARTLARLADLYARERPTLVHHVTIKPVLYGSIAAKLTGVRAVVNAISGLGFVFLSQHLSARALRVGVEVAYRVALSGPRVRVVFQNADDEALFVSRGLVDATRAIRIPGSGVDLERFAERPPHRAEVPLVVLPARLLWDKGVGEFVDAARSLRARGVRARFALVGGGSTNPASVPPARVREWVDEGLIEAWGHRTDMPDVLAEASLVVLPSYREGFPLALAEACAVGRACVTTNVPGCRDVVDDACGWRVPVRDAPALADAISDALSDRARLEAMGRRAAQRARDRFGRGAIVASHLALYEELLGDAWPRATTMSPQERRAVGRVGE
ncbi:glycosyltransferase family 4 protein [Sandaracinus amylolyticus]|uniref:Lipid carrier UDP-N-acetylgalactosaminyltransferase n=1 Tax=Sandaracinus amylolyticus TaxID=927083 RepID=A0A0F6SFI5_9BACT|nr:glycosyltransferase family 4 protein [Sandaracinus amylolyticus]AKF07004.1 Lipid carrier UDP-N-acetylgalactosaminyltransferase [Sandaracinus amylolyticus]